MSRTTATVNRSKQLKANTVAKQARREEGGLVGPRVGKISASTRRAQARRDTAPARQAAVAAADVAVAAPAAKSSIERKAIKGAKAKFARATPAKKDAGHTLTIQVNAAKSIPGGERFNAHVRELVGSAITRFAPKLTRLEVHFTDENASKEGGHDKRCRIEARPASQAPVSVSADAATPERALAAAVSKLRSLLTSHFGKKMRR